MTRWLALLIPHLLLSLVRYPLAVLAVLCFSSADRRHLTRLRWLETIDNDLAGDSGWREKHLIGSDPLSRLNRIRWLWRNGGNTLNYLTFGVCDWPALRGFAPMFASLPPFTYIRRPDGAWLYRRFIPIWPGRDLEIFLGWALLGPQQGRCKYVCSLRIRKRGP